jgi:hypothetical protein
MRRLKRAFALSLAVLIFTITPVSDYIGTRYNVYAMGGAMTAVEYVWSTILSTIGVDVSQKGLSGIIGDIGDWVQVDTRYINVYKAMGKLAFDSTVKLGQETLDMVKDYFKTKNGYGTSAGIDQIKIGSDNSFENSYSHTMGVDLSKFNPALSSDDYYFSYDHSSDNPIRHSDIFLLQKDKRVGGVLSSSKTLEIFYMNDDNKLVSPVSRVTYSNNSGTNTYYPNEKNNFSYMLISGTDYTAETMVNIPFPVYRSLDQLKTYLSYGTLGETVNEYTGSYTWVEVHSDVDTQQREVTSDVEIKIPEDSFTAEKLVESLQSAITAADRAQVLAPTMDVVYGERVTDNEQTDTYPWIPDITRPLGVITDVVKAVSKTLTGVKDRVTDGFRDVTGALSGLGSLVTSIPASIARDISATKTGDITKYKLADLKNLFPFCLPFDLIDFFGVLSAEPVAPKFTWTFPGVPRYGVPQVDLEIDLSAFNEVAKIMRTMEVLAFIVGLILITRSHMIRG